MTVNLSARQMSRPGFAGHRRGPVARTGLDAGLPVPRDHRERAAPGSEARRRDPRALEAAGIRLALDDFGTGYSSLSYLLACRSTPSRSTARSSRPRAEPHDPAITKASFGMARSLSLGVIAEGVETGSDRRAAPPGLPLGPGLLLLRGRPGGRDDAAPRRRATVAGGSDEWSPDRVGRRQGPGPAQARLRRGLTVASRRRRSRLVGRAPSRAPRAEDRRRSAAARSRSCTLSAVSS